MCHPWLYSFHYNDGRFFFSKFCSKVWLVSSRESLIPVLNFKYFITISLNVEHGPSKRSSNLNVLIFSLRINKVLMRLFMCVLVEKVYIHAHKRLWTEICENRLGFLWERHECIGCQMARSHQSQAMTNQVY